ncbi:MAG: lactate utilization protein [Butyrivibrio sp.]|nr:lactate utilization protein [Butyrivibrio sp.]
MTPKKQAYRLTADGIIAALNKRNMEGYYCDSSAEAVEKALSIMPEGSSITWGGSASIKECGLLDAIKNGRYEILDRDTASDEKLFYSRAVLSNYFLMSTNAITLDGELLNIDGRGNRVAPMIYGPDNVIMIVGMNKVVKDVESAYKRVKVDACPPNTIRLNFDTPCAKTGKCIECLSPQCICNQIVITRFSREKGRIKVILVGEELGF